MSLADLNIGEAHRLALGAGDEAVASALGAPLILTRARPDLRIVALAFDIRASDLPMRAAFPLLLGNAVAWLGAPEASETAALRTGRSLRVALPEGRAQAAVTDPAGVTQTVVGPVAGEIEIPIARTGFYRIGSSMTLAANLGDAVESDTTPAARLVICGKTLAPPDHAGAACATADLVVGADRRRRAVAGRVVDLSPSVDGLTMTATATAIATVTSLSEAFARALHPLVLGAPGWLLLLVVAPALFIVARWSLGDFTRGERIAQAVLRLLVLAGLALALARPALRRPAGDVSAVALVDVSDSVSDARSRPAPARCCAAWSRRPRGARRRTPAPCAWFASPPRPRRLSRPAAVGAPPRW